MYTLLLQLYIFNTAHVKPGVLILRFRLYSRLPQDGDLSLKRAEGFTFMESLQF